MKKISLFPVCLMLFFAQLKLDASVQTYYLNSIPSLSFEVNGSSFAVSQTVTNSILGSLKAGNILTFTANISIDPYDGPASWGVPQQQESYSLLVSNPAWGAAQYPVVTNISSISSCSLNIPGLQPIVMPTANGAAVSVKIVIVPFSNPANFTVPLAENLKNIQGFYVVDGKGRKYDVSVAMQNLQKQYGNISEATLSYYKVGNSKGWETSWGFNVDLVFKNNMKSSVPLFNTTVINTDQMGFPLSIYINGIRLVVLTTHMGWSYCRFVA